MRGGWDLLIKDNSSSIDMLLVSLVGKAPLCYHESR